MQYNPGWNGSSVNVLHVRAVGRSDALHYVWSTIGAPSVLLVATRSPDSALSIDWGRLLSPAPTGAVWIDPPGSVVYAAAVVFTKVLPRGEQRSPGSVGCVGWWWSPPPPCLNDPRSSKANCSHAAMRSWGRSPRTEMPQPERGVQRWSSPCRGDVELLEGHRNEGWDGPPLPSRAAGELRLCCPERRELWRAESGMEGWQRGGLCSRVRGRGGGSSKKKEVLAVWKEELFPARRGGRGCMGAHGLWCSIPAEPRSGMGLWVSLLTTGGSRRPLGVPPSNTFRDVA